jgi:hypothetical protein
LHCLWQSALVLGNRSRTHFGLSLVLLRTYGEL